MCSSGFVDATGFEDFRRLCIDGCDRGMYLYMCVYIYIYIDIYIYRERESILYTYVVL